MRGCGDERRGPRADADRHAYPRKEHRFFVGRTDSAIQDRDVGTGGLYDRRDVRKNRCGGGQNLYVCTAINVWTVQGVEVPDPTGKADQVLSNDGSGLAGRHLVGT